MDHIEERDAVMRVFSGFGEARQNIRQDRVAATAQTRIATALCSDHSPDAAEEIAFHVSDWIYEAAFLTALHLDPDSFTDEEIREGIDALTIHGVSHVMAAAHWAKQSLSDVFDLGLRIERD